MTRQKDLKRLVRARMKKTGEAYTSARANVLRKSVTKTASRPAAGTASAAVRSALASPSPKEYAAIAGMTDAAIKAKTGCTWEKWVKALDHHGADKLPHREIAQLIKAKYKTPSWWTQTVTVGYERIKGLRAPGQDRDGTFTMNKSRTFNVPVTQLFKAWTDARERRRWMNGTTVKVIKSFTPKSLRLDVGDGSLIAMFTAKDERKSMVAIEQAKLPDRETKDRLVTEWAQRFDRLGEALSS